MQLCYPAQEMLDALQAGPSIPTLSHNASGANSCNVAASAYTAEQDTSLQCLLSKDSIVDQTGQVEIFVVRCSERT